MWPYLRSPLRLRHFGADLIPHFCVRLCGFENDFLEQLYFERDPDIADRFRCHPEIYTRCRGRRLCNPWLAS